MGALKPQVKRLPLVLRGFLKYDKVSSLSSLGTGLEKLCIDFYSLYLFTVDSSPKKGSQEQYQKRYRKEKLQFLTTHI